MSAPVPIEWRIDPPEILVLGEGSFSSALAQIFKAEQFAYDEFHSGPAPDEKGGFPRVLNDLKSVWIIESQQKKGGGLMQAHDAVWSWVEALSRNGKEHPLAFTFVHCGSSATATTESLDLALGLSDPGRSELGYTFVSMDKPLSELLACTANVTPQDHVCLENRLGNDRRHVAIQRLTLTASKDEPNSTELGGAAAEITEIFQDAEYLLDNFCREPAHPNGNRLRGLISQIVTKGVTPSGCREVASEIFELLN